MNSLFFPNTLYGSIIYKPEALFLHNRLRRGRHQKIVIALVDVPAISFDGQQLGVIQPRMHRPLAQTHR